MSARFVAASSQSLVSSPVTGAFVPPFTVGMWINPHIVSGNPYFWTAASNASDVDYYGFDINGGDYSAVGRSVSTAAGATCVTHNAAADVWTFILGRFIKTNDMRLDILFADGITDAAKDQSNTISRVNTGTIANLGSYKGQTQSNYFDGRIGEYWVANKDVTLGDINTTALSRATLLQLAYQGPFGIPAIAQSIVEYRSLRTVGLNGTVPEDFFINRQGEDTAANIGVGSLLPINTNLNSVQSAPHPPLMANYVVPTVSPRIVPI